MIDINCVVHCTLSLWKTAEDLGGPRKEFFQQILSLTDIKFKYFDKGLREYLAKDYYTVGKIMSKF